MYIYIYIYICILRVPPSKGRESSRESPASLGRGDDMVGNPHRALISRLGLCELILLLELDRPFPVEQFEAMVP